MNLWYAFIGMRMDEQIPETKVARNLQFARIPGNIEKLAETNYILKKH